MTRESPTHRKHGRSSSPDASEDRSKRRKHRHRHRHHQHRLRSSKDKEKTLMIDEIQDGGETRGIEVEKLAGDYNIDEGVFAAKKDEFLILDFAGVDYDMEEGEIVEDEGLEKLKSGAQSDVESGEIEMANGSDDAKMCRDLLLTMFQKEEVPKMNWVRLEDKLRQDIKQKIVILSHKFHHNLLSPVRDQGDSRTDVFVSIVTIMEMLRRVNGAQTYFRIDDIYDNIYRCYPDNCKQADLDAKLYGADPDCVLRYAIEKGLIEDSHCRDPRIRNTKATMCLEAKRIRLVGYEMIGCREVGKLIHSLEQTPILAEMHYFESFRRLGCSELIYEGPSKEELRGAEHAEKLCIAVVGHVSMKFGQNHGCFLIVQDSVGISSHFNGFRLVQLIDSIFVRFWKLNGLR